MNYFSHFTLCLEGDTTEIKKITDFINNQETITVYDLCGLYNYHADTRYELKVENIESNRIFLFYDEDSCLKYFDIAEEIEKASKGVLYVAGKNENYTFKNGEELSDYEIAIYDPESKIFTEKQFVILREQDRKTKYWKIIDAIFFSSQKEYDAILDNCRKKYNGSVNIQLNMVEIIRKFWEIKSNTEIKFVISGNEKEISLLVDHLKKNMNKDNIIPLNGLIYGTEYDECYKEYFGQEVPDYFYDEGYCEFNDCFTDILHIDEMTSNVVKLSYNDDNFPVHWIDDLYHAFIVNHQNLHMSFRLLSKFKNDDIVLVFDKGNKYFPETKFYIDENKDIHYVNDRDCCAYETESIVHYSPMPDDYHDKENYYFIEFETFGKFHPGRRYETIEEIINDLNLILGLNINAKTEFDLFMYLQEFNQNNPNRAITITRHTIKES